MKIRTGNACWHAFHVMASTVAKEAGFYDEEGVDVDVVHAKVYPGAIATSRQGGPRYDEVGVVPADMVKYNIDIASDTNLRTVLMDHVQGGDLRIVGGWRNQFEGCFMAAPGIKSIKDLKGKRIGEWMKGGEYTMWIEKELLKAGLDPERDVHWVIGYQFGSQREAAKPLHAGLTDAAIVQREHCAELLEEGFNKLHDFVEAHKPHGRPERVTVARKSFIDRNPEALKRFWRAQIRAYHYMRIVPEHFPFIRHCEAKLRVNNPDELERMRPLIPMELLESYFVPLDGQPTMQGLKALMEEYKEGKKIPKSFTWEDLKATLRLEHVQEAWEELQGRDEIKKNLERLAPVVERVGY